MGNIPEDTVEFLAGCLTFAAWAALVDAEVVKITGFDREAFADWGYADAFADGVEPRDAAIAMLSRDDVGREFLALAGIDADEVLA